jgi:sugar phosphate isomerase/epimerase
MGMENPKPETRNQKPEIRKKPQAPILDFERYGRLTLLVWGFGHSCGFLVSDFWFPGRRRGIAFPAPMISVASMKLTVSTLSCPTWDLLQLTKSLRTDNIAGVDFRGLGAEIDITRLTQFTTHLDETLKLLHDNQISMPCLNTSITLISPSPERWEAMLDETQRYARLATRTHTPYLRIFGGAVPKGLTRDEGRSMAERHLRQVVKICRVYNCIPILETHDNWSRSTDILELIHAFDPQEVGVLWDLEHPWRQGESPHDSAIGLKRFVRHVHVKDSTTKTGDHHPTLLGDGVIPLADCATALTEIAYDGWYCLEVEKRWDSSAPDPEKSLPNFANYMRQRWNR